MPKYHIQSAALGHFQGFVKSSRRFLSLLGGCGVVSRGGAESRGGETDDAVPAVDGGCSVLLEAAAAALISAVTIPQKLQPDCDEPACGQPNTLRSLR